MKRRPRQSGCLSLGFIKKETALPSEERMGKGPVVIIECVEDIPCVPYSTFGTEELATFVAEGLSHRDACLMANHGQITIREGLWH